MLHAPSCHSFRARWPQFRYDFVHHLDFINEGSGAHGANGGESKSPYVQLFFSHHLVYPVDSGGQGMIGAFIGALFATGHDDDAAYAFGETVQVELIWKKYRGSNSKNIRVGRVRYVCLPYGIGTGIGTGFCCQDQYFLPVFLLCHAAIHLFLAHNEDAVVAICFKMAKKIVPYLVGPDRNIVLGG